MVMPAGARCTPGFFTRPLSETAAIGLIGDAMWLVATGAGLWGLAGALREGLHNRLFFLAWIGYSLLTVLIFHVEPRYLLPLWTLLALYGAGTLANVKGKRQKAKALKVGRRRRKAKPLKAGR